MNKKKGKVEEVPKKKILFFCNGSWWVRCQPLLPRFKASVGEKLMATSIAVAGGPKEGHCSLAPRQGSSKMAKTSSRSLSTKATPRLRLFVTQRSDELVPEVLTILSPEVETALATFYKF